VFITKDGHLLTDYRTNKNVRGGLSVFYQGQLLTATVLTVSDQYNYAIYTVERPVTAVTSIQFNQPIRNMGKYYVVTYGANSQAVQADPTTYEIEGREATNTYIQLVKPAPVELSGSPVFQPNGLFVGILTGAPESSVIDRIMPIQTIAKDIRSDNLRNLSSVLQKIDISTATPTVDSVTESLAQLGNAIVSQTPRVIKLSPPKPQTQAGKGQPQKTPAKKTGSNY
jgi:hypothetical protein